MNKYQIIIILFFSLYLIFSIKTTKTREDYPQDNEGFIEIDLKKYKQKVYKMYRIKKGTDNCNLKEKQFLLLMYRMDRIDMFIDSLDEKIIRSSNGEKLDMEDF